MPPLQDYALIGNCETAALVSPKTSIDWLCWPRFDSPACFGAVRDGRGGGFWRFVPQAGEARFTRRYRGPTPILETEIETATGRALVTDFMPTKIRDSHVVRRVEGLAGESALKSELAIVFADGAIVPYARRQSDNSLHFIAGPDRVTLRTTIKHEPQDEMHVAAFRLNAGETVEFSLTYTPSYADPPRLLDPAIVLEQTERTWRAWIGRCTDAGPYSAAVIRALVTLRTMIYQPSGAIVAGVGPACAENEDAPACRLDGAHLSMHALLDAGYEIEAKAWRNFLLRACGGEPAKLQKRYSLVGDRLGGEAAPVSLYGEIVDAFCEGRRRGLNIDPADWSLEAALLRQVEAMCASKPYAAGAPAAYDELMALIAFAGGAEAVGTFGLVGPRDHWRALQSGLMARISGKAIAADPRCLGLAALDVPPDLDRHLAARWPALAQPTEMSFYQVAVLARIGRRAEAQGLFERLCGLGNDLGLHAEAYDVASQKRSGRFPDAGVHVALINAAYALLRSAKA